MSDEKKQTLEERFQILDEIINKMENGDATLDQSFELYKSGIEEVKQCNAMLDSMEKAMLVLNSNGELEEFE